MSKSSRSWQCHARAMQQQGKLTTFGFKAPLYQPLVRPKECLPKASTSFIQTSLEPPSEAPTAPVTIDLTASPPASAIYLPSSSTSRVRSSSMLSDPSTDNDKRDGMETEAATMNEDVEDAEDELDEQAQGPGKRIYDWADL